MPQGVIQRVCQVWKEIKEVCRNQTRDGRPPMMTSQAVDIHHWLSVISNGTKLQMMLALLEHSPDLHLDEFQEGFKNNMGLISDSC
jgi:hypothetical protein